MVTNLWPGPSQEELDRSVEKERRGVEERRKTRIKASANITIAHPNAQDFDRWFGKGEDGVSGRNK